MRRLIPILWLALAAPLCAQTVDLAKCPDCKILVPVDVSTELGKFRSAIQMTAAEFTKKTAQEISQAREKLAADWVALVKENSSKPPVAPTKEQLQEITKAQSESLSLQVAALVAAKPTEAEVADLKAKLQAALDELGKVIDKPTVEEKP